MTKTQRKIPLHKSHTGQWIRIISLPHGVTGAQFVRLGISEGEKVKCLERLPGGTVIIQKNRQQIAIGHQLARQIFVIILHDEE